MDFIDAEGCFMSPAPMPSFRGAERIPCHAPPHTVSISSMVRHIAHGTGVMRHVSLGYVKLCVTYDHPSSVGMRIHCSPHVPQACPHVRTYCAPRLVEIQLHSTLLCAATVYCIRTMCVRASPISPLLHTWICAQCTARSTLRNIQKLFIVVKFRWKLFCPCFAVSWHDIGHLGVLRGQQCRTGASAVPWDATHSKHQICFPV